MKTRSRANPRALRDLAILLAIWPMVGMAQVPVDENGNPIGEFTEYDEQIATTSDAEIPLASPAELETLVGPVALYPDDLLAIILPASTFPLQLVEAARFLEELESDPSRKPDDDWDDSVVALTNYPEVIELLNSDLDWTWQLGEAVVAQQADVIAAIEVFRDRAYAAGNLQSDEHQNVTEEDGVIEISPVSEDIIYVPYYEPERVVVYQPRRVYNYYPRPYPVYYYPYAYGHSFNHGYFWGVTTAFTIGWATDYLHVFHHSYHGHPYYGYSYNNRWWYRRPSINVYNSYYVNNRHRWSNDRYRRGDRWYSHNSRRMNRSDQRVTRTRYLPSNDTHVARNRPSSGFAPSTNRNNRSAGDRNRNTQRQPGRDNVRNRSGNTTGSNATTNRRTNANTSVPSRKQPAGRTARPNSGRDIEFRSRAGKPSAGRETQERNNKYARRGSDPGTVSKRTSTNRSSTIRSSTDRRATRSTTEPNIRFAPRNDKRSSVTSRENSKRSLRTPRTSDTRNTTVARQNSKTTRSSFGGKKNATSSRRAAPTRAAPTKIASSRSNSTTRARSDQRGQKSSSSRPQQQRQSAPRQQRSKSSSKQSRSSSKSQSGSGSRSKSRNVARNSRRD